MSDTAFKSAPFAGFSTQELEARISQCAVPGPNCAAAQAEIDRRAKVAAGDVSVMTPAERLRHNRQSNPNHPR